MSKYKIIGKGYSINHNDTIYTEGEYFTVPDEVDKNFEGDTTHFKKIEKKKAASPSKKTKKEK